MKDRVAIIAGAGPAGLTAALELLDRTDVVPVVYEADTSVGGLAKTIQTTATGSTSAVTASPRARA